MQVYSECSIKGRSTANICMVNVELEISGCTKSHLYLEMVVFNAYMHVL